MELLQEMLESPTVWLLIGLGLVYVAGRVLLVSLVDVKHATSAQLGRATALPIGLAAAMAVALGRPDAGVALLFATAVGALTLVTGLTASVEPAGPVPVVWRRVWIFLIPTALLALLAGFSGQLTLTHALVFGVQGGLVLLVVEAAREEFDDEPMPVLPAAAVVPQRRRWARGVEAGLAGAVLLAGSWLMLDASPQPRSAVARFSDALLAVGVWSPVLLLPMVGSAATMAQAGRTTAVVGGAVVLALINLCVMVPVVILVWHAWPWIERTIAGGRVIASTTRAVEVEVLSRTPLNFPMASWRLDSVILLILAVALLPVAMGRWTLGRREGVALVVLYALYLIGSAMVGTRYY